MEHSHDHFSLTRHDKYSSPYSHEHQYHTSEHNIMQNVVDDDDMPDLERDDYGLYLTTFKKEKKKKMKCVIL